MCLLPATTTKSSYSSYKYSYSAAAILIYLVDELKKLVELYACSILVECILGSPALCWGDWPELQGLQGFH